MQANGAIGQNGPLYSGAAQNGEDTPCCKLTAQLRAQLRESQVRLIESQAQLRQLQSYSIWLEQANAQLRGENLEDHTVDDLQKLRTLMRSALERVENALGMHVFPHAQMWEDQAKRLAASALQNAGYGLQDKNAHELEQRLVFLNGAMQRVQTALLTALEREMKARVFGSDGGASSNKRKREDAFGSDGGASSNKRKHEDAFGSDGGASSKRAASYKGLLAYL